MQHKTDIDKFLGVIFIFKAAFISRCETQNTFFRFFFLFLKYFYCRTHTNAMHNLVIYYVAIEIPQSGAFCLLYILGINFVCTKFFILNLHTQSFNDIYFLYFSCTFKIFYYGCITIFYLIHEQM